MSNNANSNRKKILAALQVTLPDYVVQNTEPLISKTIFQWTPSINYMMIQTGLRCRGNLTLLNVDTEFQSCGCGWTPSGNVDLSNKEIEVVCIKLMDAICPEQLICTYGQWYVNRYTKGLESWQVDFEQSLVNSILASVSKNLDKLIWQGSTDPSVTDPNLNRFDGIVTQLVDAASGAVRITTTGPLLQQLYQIQAAIPVDTFSYGEPIIYVGIDYLRFLALELVNLNWYNQPSLTSLDFTTGAPYIILPGTNTRVVGVYGLSGSGYAIGTFMGNVWFGTDFASDYETLDFWYSKDNQEWRYAMEFFAGAAIAYDDLAVLATLSPVDTSNLGALNVNITAPLNAAGTAVQTQELP